MQTFYEQLNTGSGQATYLSFLERLTKASRINIRSLPNSLGWGNWGI